MKRANTSVWIRTIALIGLIAFAMMFASATACKPTSSPNDAEAGIVNTEASAPIPPIVVPPGLCANLTGIDSSGTLTTICATVEEIAQIIILVTNLRSLPDAGTSPSTVTPGCTPLPPSPLCATPIEVSKGIRLILAKRKANLSLDAGTR